MNAPLVINTTSVTADSPSAFLKLRLGDVFQYLFAGAIFVLYGVQVCPFLDSLERPFFVSVVSVLFIAMFIVRSLCLKWLVEHSINGIVRRQFILDMLVFLGGGVVLAVGNQIVYDFPIRASLRVMLGVGLLGFLISLQLMLQMEKTLIHLRQQSPPKRYLSITTKIQWFCLSLLIGALLTMLLLVYKDLEWLATVGDEVSVEQAVLWILYEFLFVSVVFAIYGLLICRGFSQNVKAYFDFQNTTLEALKKGERQLAVPVISNDEFSVTAHFTNQMIENLRAAEQDLCQTRDAAILAISSLAETRDNETGAHILRTQEYVKALGLYLRGKEKFKQHLDTHTLELIHKSAPLHDIGKVGIPDAILLKPGKLTDEEFTTMKQHPIIGRLALEKAEEQTGPLPFLRYAKEISESHHEKWDGSGYPYGLKGDAIPLSGRLMALADVYDALITQRVYKPAFSHEKARGIILEGKGSHFDPDIVDAFIAIEQEFICIAKAHP